MTKFKLGTLCFTRGINERVADDETFSNFVLASLKRHASGDWGDVCDLDKKENEFSLKEGFRILSAYTMNETKIWIITEAGRSATTVLYPDEYYSRSQN